MVWALRPVSGLEQLLTFEVQFNELLASRPATVVCLYARAGVDVFVSALTWDEDRRLGLTEAARAAVQR